MAGRPHSLHAQGAPTPETTGTASSSQRKEHVSALQQFSPLHGPAECNRHPCPVQRSRGRKNLQNFPWIFKPSDGHKIQTQPLWGKAAGASTEAHEMNLFQDNYGEGCDGYHAHNVADLLFPALVLLGLGLIPCRLLLLLALVPTQHLKPQFQALPSP